MSDVLISQVFQDNLIYDSQCGLKVIRRDAFASIEEHLKEARFAFDVELTLLLLANGFRIREVPINWKEVPGSKVSVFMG